MPVLVDFGEGLERCGVKVGCPASPPGNLWWEYRTTGAVATSLCTT